MWVGIPKGVCDSGPVPFDGRRASVKVMKEIPEKVADITYRGIPEVHLLFHIPSLENGPF